jgi:hypothetical protein
MPGTGTGIAVSSRETLTNGSAAKSISPGWTAKTCDGAFFSSTRK